MFEYIRRGITRRKRQTAIISIGMALAVAAVMVISAASSGIAAAQSSVLQAVHGVGTDLTITSSPTRGEGAQSGGGNRMQFGPEAGQTGADGSTTLSSTRVMVAPGVQTMGSTVLDTLPQTSGVAAATGTLSLTQMDFSGSIQQQDSGGSGDSGSSDQQAQPGAPGEGGGPGGLGGFGGGSFDLAQTSIMGVDPSATEVGPLSDMTVSSGALLTSEDEDAAVVSPTYASDNSVAVGDTITLGSDTTATVVGILSEVSSQGASDVYVPLALAFLLASLFTISSVTRRTRELGTLKAIGWSNSRVLGNVVAETLVQTLIGGLLGLAIGVAAVLGINAAGITLGGSAGASPAMPGMSQQMPAGQGAAPGDSSGTGSGADTGPGAGTPGAGAQPGMASASTSTTILHLEPSAAAVALGVGVSLLGGVVAGGAGAIKVSRLRPAAALRSVD